MADDVSTRTLRRVLRRLDYRVHGWRLGRNIGPTAQCVSGLRDRMEELSDRYGEPVTLIGWSLRGVLPRGRARRSPEGVGPVLTAGTPVPREDHRQDRGAQGLRRDGPLA